MDVTVVFSLARCVHLLRPISSLSVLALRLLKKMFESLNLMFTCIISEEQWRRQEVLLGGKCRVCGGAPENFSLPTPLLWL